MKKISIGFILATFIAISGCGSDDGKPEEEFIEPEVITLEATEITETSAKLAGFLVSEGSVTQPVDRLLCLSLNMNPTVDDYVNFADGSGTGEYFVNVNNLLQNTTYNVRAAIVYINSEGLQHVAYGNNISFTTMEETDEVPIIHVESTAPTHITSRKVTLNATVFDSEQNLGSRGFTVSTNENPTIGSGSSQSGGSGAGVYSVDIENLEANTTYFARPYV
ncbi:MAG TPA: hypothetical protein VFD80_09345, partial [Flavobacteriaceae bacterium]|nr:hypothetical protein [Flavobacteriaceae bacterium]